MRTLQQSFISEHKASIARPVSRSSSISSGMFSHITRLFETSINVQKLNRIVRIQFYKLSPKSKHFNLYMFHQYFGFIHICIIRNILKLLAINYLLCFIFYLNAYRLLSAIMITIRRASLHPHHRQRQANHCPRKHPLL